MSRHYIAQRQSCFGGQTANIEEIIRAFAGNRSGLAQRIATMDKAPIIAKVARDALAEVAACVSGATLVDRFERPRDFHAGAWQPPSGECVGVLRLSDNRQIGLIRNGDALALHAVFPQDIGKGDIGNVQKRIERAYCQRMVVAVIEILGGDFIERRTMPDGTVVLTFEDRVGGGGVR